MTLTVMTSCDECGWYDGCGLPKCEHVVAAEAAAEGHYYTELSRADARRAAALTMVWACSLCGAQYSEPGGERPHQQRCNQCERTGQVMQMSVTEANARSDAC